MPYGIGPIRWGTFHPEELFKMYAHWLREMPAQFQDPMPTKTATLREPVKILMSPDGSYTLVEVPTSNAKVDNSGVVSAGGTSLHQQLEQVKAEKLKAVEVEDFMKASAMKKRQQELEELLRSKELQRDRAEKLEAPMRQEANHTKVLSLTRLLSQQIPEGGGKTTGVATLTAPLNSSSGCCTDDGTEGHLLGAPSGSGIDGQACSQEETALDGELPSVGSASHAAKECRPCLFHIQTACVKGAQCDYCHFPHEELRNKKLRPSKKTRQKWERQTARKLQALYEASDRAAQLNLLQSGI